MIPACEKSCPQCGAVLSAVTWTCVRGDYCKPKRRRGIDIMNTEERIAAGLDPNGGYDGPTGAD